MKDEGFKHTKTMVAGHQDCGYCHPWLKNCKKRGRRIAKKDLQSRSDEV